MARILFINRVFPPTPGATGQLLWELTGDLARRGHEVTVLTGGDSPAPPDSAPPGVSVERYGGGQARHTGLRGKAVGYARQFPSMLWRLRRMPAMDMWVSMTDPPMQAVAVAAMKRGDVRLLHWAQDVYPDVAVELGVLRRGGMVARMCERLTMSALHRHDRVIVVGRCMADRMEARDPERARPVVIPNWAPLPDAQPDDDERRRRFRALLAPDGARLVMYSGNFGRAHPFEAIAEAVRLTSASDPSLYWAFIGDGPKFAWLSETLGSLPRVSFLPAQPWSDLRVTLGAADVHLASMEDNLVGTVVPSKVYGALAMGRPCLLLGPTAGEAARLIHDTGAGTVLEQASGGILAAEIARMFADDKAWEAMQAAAVAATREVSRSRCLDRWAAVIDNSLPRQETRAGENPSIARDQSGTEKCLWQTPDGPGEVSGRGRGQRFL